MVTLSSLRGRGVFTLVTPDGRTITMKGRDTARILDSMATDVCRAYHVAARQGNLQAAQRIFCEAAAAYYAC